MNTTRRTGFRSRSPVSSFLILLAVMGPLGAAPSGQAPDRAPGHSESARVALVLSGGGARGGAHIGVLRALGKAGIPIDLIVGTSFGALVGGLYSVGYSTHDIERIVASADWNELFTDAPERDAMDLTRKRRKDRSLIELQADHLSVSLPRGLQSGQRIRQMLDRLTLDPVFRAGNDFDRLPVPFRAVAADLLTGRKVVFSAGSLGLALESSIAVPGIFAPVDYSGTLLVDGGIADNLPVDVARQCGAEVVIAVDVSSPLITDKSQIRSLVDVLDQIVTLHIEENKKRNLSKADVVIAPDLAGFESSDFGKAASLISVGRRAAEGQLVAIREILKSKGIALRTARLRPDLLAAGAFRTRQFALSSAPITLAQIRFKGLERLPKKVVAGRFQIRQGTALTPAKIDRGASRLYGTGLFERVGSELAGPAGGAILTYDLQEAPPTRLGFGFRYDSDYRFAGAFDLSSRKNADTSLFLTALVGDYRSLDAGVKLGRKLAFVPHFSVHSQQRLLYQGDDRRGDFQDRRYGFALPLEGLLGDWGRLDFGYAFERVDIDRGLASFRQASGQNLSRLSAAFLWDTLDRSDFPDRGVQGFARLDWNDEVLGSDLSYRRFEGRFREYFSPGDKHTLKVAAFAGLSGGNIPFYEEFFSGGFSGLSYASQPLLGSDRDRFLSRGTAHFLASYRYRLKHIQLGIVKDVYLGLNYNLGLFSSDSDPLELRNPLHGYGMGVYLDTFWVGPVRLDFGGTNRGDFKVYFSVGHNF